MKCFVEGSSVLVVFAVVTCCVNDATVVGAVVEALDSDLWVFAVSVVSPLIVLSCCSVEPSSVVLSGFVMEAISCVTCDAGSLEVST